MEEKKNVEKSPERLAVLDRIARLELEGKFDVDAEEDPPTLPLLRVKPGSKMKVKMAYAVANKFVDGLLKNEKLVIKEVHGMEYLNGLDSGALYYTNVPVVQSAEEAMKHAVKAGMAERRELAIAQRRNAEL